METVTKIPNKKETIHLSTIFEVVNERFFAKEDSNLEIEWIEQELAFAKQKLVTGAATLQRETISQLMTLISKLTLKKDFLESDNSTSTITQMDNIEDDQAWRLHKKFQSSLELKVKEVKNQELSDDFFI
jgi:hypothetical protein